MATTGHRASSPSWPLGGDPGPWLLTLAPGAIAMPWGITSRHPGLAWEAGRLQRAQPIGSICAKTLAEQKGKQPSRGADAQRGFCELDFIKIKNFCALKDTIKKVTAQKNRRKYLKIIYLIRSLYPEEYIKDCYKSNNK